MITSESNSQIKQVIALQTKTKARKKENAFVVEGIRITGEIHDDELLKLYIAESLYSGEEGRNIIKNLPMDKVEIVSDNVFRKISQTVTPQGVLAVVKKKKYNLDDLLPNLAKKKGCYLVLESIQDPGNLGTIIRVAEGAGVCGIIMNETTVDIYSPKVIRSTMGSIFRMPFVISDDLAGDVTKLQKCGVKIFAAHLDGKNYYYQEELGGLTGFMIGNEGNGLTDELAALADTYIKIPMEGEVESLNASMATGILVYEAKRQRDVI